MKILALIVLCFVVTTTTLPLHNLYVNPDRIYPNVFGGWDIETKGELHRCFPNVFGGYDCKRVR